MPTRNFRKRHRAVMTLADTVHRTRSGLFQIVFLDSSDRIVAQGSGFASRGFLITNNHVFAGPPDAKVWIRNEHQVLLKQGVVLSRSDFMSRLVTGSDKNSFDYAVLRVPEVTREYITLSLDHPQTIGLAMLSRYWVSFLSI